MKKLLFTLLTVATVFGSTVPAYAQVNYGTPLREVDPVHYEYYMEHGCTIGDVHNATLEKYPEPSYSVTEYKAVKKDDSVVHYDPKSGYIGDVDPIIDTRRDEGYPDKTINVSLFNQDGIIVNYMGYYTEDSYSGGTKYCTSYYIENNTDMEIMVASRDSYYNGKDAGSALCPLKSVKPGKSAVDKCYTYSSVIDDIYGFKDNGVSIIEFDLTIYDANNSSNYKKVVPVRLDTNYNIVIY